MSAVKKRKTVGKNVSLVPKSSTTRPKGKVKKEKSVTHSKLKKSTEAGLKKTQKKKASLKERIAARKQKKMINQAIEGVRLLEKQLQEKKSNDLLGDDEESGLIYMQVGMVKVTNLLPVKHVIRPIKIKVPLPHSIVNSNTEVLLIARDEDSKKKRELRKDFSEHLHKFQDMLRMTGAARHISELMTLRQLKVEYKEYEAKRHLANRFDVVLCDDTIIRRIPLFLGKHFYKQRKSPIQVNLKAKNLAAEIEKALKTQALWLPMTGNSGIMTIGRLDQSNNMIEANIMAALEKLKEKFPGGWKNIQSIGLKTMTSKSVPFYARLCSANTIEDIAPKPLYGMEGVAGEVSTAFGKPVFIYPDGDFKFITHGELKNREMREKKKQAAIEQKQGKKQPKKKKKVLESDDLVEGEAPKKKMKAEETSAQKGKKLKSNMDSLEVEDLNKMEMEYLRRISKKNDEKKADKSSSKKSLPDDDSDDDEWAEFSDDNLSDVYDELF